MRVIPTAGWLSGLETPWTIRPNLTGNSCQDFFTYTLSAEVALRGHEVEDQAMLSQKGLDGFVHGIYNSHCYPGDSAGVD